MKRNNNNKYVKKFLFFMLIFSCTIFFKKTKIRNKITSFLFQFFKLVENHGIITQRIITTKLRITIKDTLSILKNLLLHPFKTRNIKN